MSRAVAHRIITIMKALYHQSPLCQSAVDIWGQNWYFSHLSLLLQATDNSL